MSEQTEPIEWTVQGFLNQFDQINETAEDHSFCFLLGAGASVSSGIKTGGQMAKEWLEQLHVQHAENATLETREKWAAEYLDIEEFCIDNAAAHYSQIYDARFDDYPDLGYAYLEKAMEQKEPHIGYSILARILSDTRHKVVITTNFDNLVADALSIYSDTFPLVCGHESLAQFARTRLRRPLIAKIHRDLLFAPHSTANGTSELPVAWKDSLTKLFKNYTPIVLGYGGNDGSLMDFLESLKHKEIAGGIYWCYRIGEEPNPHIKALVAKHKGKLIPIPGFDELMVQLGKKLNIGSQADLIKKQAKERETNYIKAYDDLLKGLDSPDQSPEMVEARKPVKQAIMDTATAGNDWWSWEVKARNENDPEKREAIYRAGIEKCPSSHELMGNFALFMEDIRKEYDEAGQLYRKALELDPTNATITGNFANFMKNIRKDHDKAELLYRRARDLNPANANITGNFANFMMVIREKYDEAETLYREALELAPTNATITGNFANFMENIRKDHDKAEILYRKALELDPADTDVMTNFAVFLSDVRLNYSEAEPLYRKILELEPQRTSTLGNLSELLIIKRHIPEAKSVMDQFWASLSSKMSEEVYALGIFHYIICQLESDNDPSGLQRLKWMISQSEEPCEWHFDPLLKNLKPTIPADEMEFIYALTRAVIDPTEASKLDAFDKWKDLDPIDPNEPWELWTAQ